MNETKLDGIDAVLSDRLRELGMDYVADVMEGKRQPSQTQAMLLQTGRTMPRPMHQGTLLVGGANDGDRVRANPQQMRTLQVPRPMINERLFSLPESQVPDRGFGVDQYYAERLAVLDRQFWFYRLSDVPIESAISMLFQNYESPNAVYS